MSDLFALAERLERAGEPFVIATVVRAEKPTSAKAGDKAIVTARGLIDGWIGGSCAEPTVLREANAALEDGECRLLHISPESEPEEGREGLTFVPMSCYSGGTLEIYLEPHLAAPHLVVFGHSPVARALRDIARVMKYRVTAVDLRDEAAAPDDDSVIRDLARLSGLRAGYAVVATHGVFDEEALEHALAMEASYVALVASRRRADAVRTSLLERGVGSSALARVKSPAGLDLGARSAEEIALSIMAEIVGVRRSAQPSIAPARSTSASAPAEVAPPTERARTASTSTAEAGAKSCCAEAPKAQLHDSLCEGTRDVRAILLAAGESRRMGGVNKLLIPIDGVPLVRRSAQTILASGIERPVVVLGFEAERVRDALAGLEIEFVLNESFREGQETSVRAGLAVLPKEIDGVMICLADQPSLTPADLREIRTAFLRRARGSVLVPMVRGLRGNPIVLDRHGLDRILARGGKFGCRQLTTHHADLVEPYEMSNDHALEDIDEPEDVRHAASPRVNDS